MKNNLSFEFIVDKDTNTLTAKREFAAPLSLVWAAWTTAEILDQWWASEGWESSTKTMEFKEGGLRHYVMRGPEEAVHWGITTYVKIQIHDNFSGKECFADEQAVVTDDMPPSDYQITFFDRGEKTYIEHHTTYNNLEELEQSRQYGYEEGMLNAFSRLDAFLEKS